MATTSTEADEIARATLDVEQSKAQLTASLRQVGNSSAKLAKRLGDELKPSVTVVAAVAGAALLLGVGIAVVRRGRRQRGWLAPERPSVLGTVAKTAGLLALRFVARRMAEAAVKHWATAPEATSGAHAGTPQQG